MTGPRLEVTPASVYESQWSAMLSTVAATGPDVCLGVGPGDAILVVGAHPDDETFGFGASIASLSNLGVDVHALTMSAGEAAVDHVGHVVEGLGDRRAMEYASACKELGTVSSTVLDLPDGGLAQHRDELGTALAGMVDEVDPAHILTVWWSDPHPDHQAVGEASVAVGRALSLPVSGFPVWAQHWSDPAGDTVRSQALQPMSNDAVAAEARRLAVACYRSQTQPLSSDLGPVVPATLVRGTTEVLVRG